MNIIYILIILFVMAIIVNSIELVYNKFKVRFMLQSFCNKAETAKKEYDDLMSRLMAQSV